MTIPPSGASRTRRLRIAQLAPVILPVPPEGAGGTERVVSDLTDALLSLGHEVTLVAPTDSRTGARLLGRYPSLQALQRRHGAVAPGVPAMLEAVQLDLLRRHLPEFDLVHCHGEFAHAALLGEAVPHLTTVHWRLDELDRRMFFGHFDALPVAAISAAQARDLPPGNLLGVVHHGIPAGRFRPGPGGGPLAFIGRMTDQKRPERAIAVARRAGMALRLAGGVDGGNPEHFDRHVRPGLGGDVAHVGELDERGKQALLGEASALLFPVDWPEPFGLVMIEAMACGTPVIGWNRGSVAEIVEHGVTGFVVEDEREAVDALGRLPELDRAAIRARFEQRFTADRMAERYLELYRRLLARRAGMAAA